ncbi:hypothetical protein [uncultured Amnibacterium sp.]|uniref:hypothetical protein n=1 Tax=uncultured Amnibacterium sp. TaxID=1631851 RepID=UPI0035C9852A
MTTLPGNWILTIRTPIGAIEAHLTFSGDDGAITGTATGQFETVDLVDVRASPTDQGERVTWMQLITKPVRLNLEFDVVVEGDTMRGFSRAGRLPKSAVTGDRSLG